MPVFDTAGTSTYTVPSGVETIRVIAEGAGGGGGGGSTSVSDANEAEGGNGASGGYIDGKLSVTPGQNLTVYVASGGGGGLADGTFPGNGGSGWDAGGTGGSGGFSGSFNSGSGGGGAGSSAVVDGSTFIVAEGGGGGGGGGESDGNNGGGGGGGGARGGSGGAGGFGSQENGEPGADGEDVGNGGNGGTGGEADSGSALPGDNGSGGGQAQSGFFDVNTTGSGNSGGSGGAISANGSGGTSGTITITEAPPRPTLTVTDTRATEIDVDIGDTSNEDSAELEYKEANVSTWTTAATYASGELPVSETISNLDNGITYDIRITVTNSAGSSDTETQATTVLPAPTNLGVNTVDADSISVTWTANHANGETRIEYREDDSGSWVTDNTVAFDTEAETIFDLLNGQLYGLRVVAQTDYIETVDQ